MRLAYLVTGWMCVGLGLLGAALPLLPTVPFMLLAAACFARASPAVHDWLVNHPRFGPSIRDWRSHGAIGARAKRMAVASMAVSLAIPLALGAAWYVLAMQAAALTGAAAFVLTRPSPPVA
jgi:uncharacterized membrane protein YbaN (DUF454 family)